MWDSYLVWLNKNKIKIYDEIPNKVFQGGVSGKVWTEYLNISEKAHNYYKQEAKHW